MDGVTFSRCLCLKTVWIEGQFQTRSNVMRNDAGSLWITLMDRHSRKRIWWDHSLCSLIHIITTWPFLQCKKLHTLYTDTGTLDWRICSQHMYLCGRINLVEMIKDKVRAWKACVLRRFCCKEGKSWQGVERSCVVWGSLLWGLKEEILDIGIWRENMKSFSQNMFEFRKARLVGVNQAT